MGPDSVLVSKWEERCGICTKPTTALSTFCFQDPFQVPSTHLAQVQGPFSVYRHCSHKLSLPVARSLMFRFSIHVDEILSQRQVGK